MRYVLRGIALLFLVALIVAQLYQRPTQYGLMVSPVTAECPIDSMELFDRRIRLRVMSDGQLFVNDDTVGRTKLRSRLHEIYQQRAARMIFIQAEDDLPFEDVASVIETAATVKDLKIVLITPSVRSACETTFRSMPAGAALLFNDSMTR